jgi:hypothetical protein
MTGARIGELSARISRCTDLETSVEVALCGLAELFGYDHSLLLLLDEDGTRLYMIGSYGYDTSGIGSEVVVGEGVIGMAAARAAPMRVGNLRQLRKYSRATRRSYAEASGEGPGREIPLPGLAHAESQLAVPAMALGQLLGVLAVESHRGMAFGADDEGWLTVVGGLVASAIEINATSPPVDGAATPITRRHATSEHGSQVARVRFYSVDGSAFLDGDYLIKGVAGRILWSLLNTHVREGRSEFTNREVRLDPQLELPAFRDNLEGRLLLLQRRLEERTAPIRIQKTGRGRFRLLVTSDLQLEASGIES